MSLDTLLSEKTGDFNVVAHKFDGDGPMQDRALEIVRQFIIDKGLKIYGGTAIDFALRLKGRSIYPDSKKPDYDFFSPDNAENAYELADLLQKKGFRNVAAIRAIHVQTVRVRVDFIYVADISYAPPDVFRRLPTVVYSGMQVVHPDYQRLDMHLGFCFPFSGAPREDVFHRWAKDNKRLALFQEVFPVKPGDLLAPIIPSTSIGGGAATTVTLKTDIAVDPKQQTLALHGIAAFGLLVSALLELKQSLGLPSSKPDTYPAVPVAISKSTVSVTLPAEHAAAFDYIPVASPEPLKICDARKGGAGVSVQWYEPYMDSKPEYAIITSPGESPLHVFSVTGRQLAVAAVRAGDTRVLMVTPQYLLLYFLHEAHQAKEETTRSIFTQYYAWALDILREGANLIAERMAKPAGKEYNPDTFVNTSPFGLVTRTMGNINHNAAYIINMAMAASDVKDVPPPALHLGPVITKILDGLPKRGYYPSQGKKRPPKFDYSKSIMYQRSGAPKAGPDGI